MDDDNPLRDMSRDIREEQDSSQTPAISKSANADEKTLDGVSLPKRRLMKQYIVLALADNKLTLVDEPPLESGEIWPYRSIRSRLSRTLWMSSIETTSPVRGASVDRESSQIPSSNGKTQPWLAAWPASRGASAGRESSRDLAYDPGWLYLTSTLKRYFGLWVLLHLVHNILGFGGIQRQEGEDSYGFITWGGDLWTRCKSYAARFLNGAHAIVGNSSGLLTTACLLGSIPHVAGAPHSPGKTMHDRALDIESFMIGLESIVFTLAPVVVWLAAAARLWYIVNRRTRKLGHPIYSGALAGMAGFAYWAVRWTVGEPASKEETILAVFMACWTSFVADTHKMISNKHQYLLRVVFGGGIACLLVTAMQFIDQEPHKAAQQTVTAPLINQTAEVEPTSEPGALGSQVATAYLSMAKTNAPISLIITSAVFYLWQIHIEGDPVSTSTTPAAPE